MNITAAIVAILPRLMKKTPMTTDPVKMLDVSNYLYGVAALLTLLATFGVIYYGRLASRLKDSQIKQYQSEADARIAEANRASAESNRLAAAANEKAEEAKVKILELTGQNLDLQHRQGGVEARQLTVETNLADTNTRYAPRVVVFSSEQVASFRPYAGSKILIVTQLGDNEATRIVASFVHSLSPGINVTAGTIAGPSATNPLSIAGVHLHYAPGAEGLATNVQRLLGANGLSSDVAQQNEIDHQMFISVTELTIYIGPKT